MPLGPTLQLHRILLAVLLLGNAVAFAGLDPVTRAVSAALVLAVLVDLRTIIPLPRLHRAAVVLAAGLVVLQLAPLPEALRRLVQPGLAEVMAPGWAPLSVAPWATLQVAGSLVIALGVALAAARMAATRSGLPALLGLLASIAALLALLGLASEAGAPEHVLLVRANAGGGSPYGPYVNRNHFALGMELALPAAAVLLAASVRHLSLTGLARKRAVIVVLASGSALTVGLAALLRSGSRGGPVFLAAAAVLTLSLWLRRRRGVRWPWLVLAAVVAAGSIHMAWTRLPELRERMSSLFVVEGLGGNSRWDLWAGTAGLWARSPVVGCGLGAYRHVSGLDKPSTGAARLEQAHNDWLEWSACGGAVGAAVLVLGVLGIGAALAPRRLRRLRSEYRYPLAGAALAMVATGLHEMVGFGLYAPVNRYLLAVWVGLVWGLHHKIEARRREESVDEALGPETRPRAPEANGTQEPPMDLRA